MLCSCLMRLSGQVIWQQPQPTGLQSSLPVLNVPDLDSDRVADVVLVASGNTQVMFFMKFTCSNLTYRFNYFVLIYIVIQQMF